LELPVIELNLNGKDLHPNPSGCAIYLYAHRCMYILTGARLLRGVVFQPDNEEKWMVALGLFP